MVQLNTHWDGETRLPNGTVILVVHSICQQAGPSGRPHSKADVHQAQEMVDSYYLADNTEGDSLFFAASE